MSAADLAGRDDALRALLVPFEHGALDWPADGRVLFLGARAGEPLQRWASPAWLCQQNLKPFADALQRAGLKTGEPASDEQFACVLLLLPRQRDERRAVLARALDHCAPGGVIVASVANHDGARSAQGDMAKLAGTPQALSKHKCRVFWVTPEPASVDDALRRAWREHDALRPTVDGMTGRPGLFAWDRIDPASALLAEHLPEDLAGRVADLGAGAGYLSVQLVRRCPQVRHVDLYEADARALPAARANMQAACKGRAHAPSFAVHWHDVVAGLPECFDAIVSNPPFHQGHADLPQLGRAFIAAAAAALRPGGRFLMVANRHLAYEATLREHFAESRPLAERDGFKIFEARR
ncbi:MAG TPA: class I SAM-dependent methyltransferase [Oleiagrimonas sp.]|nr:class I SAM-dependent methyltransferase [Oleiagrimonas sp.]